jgi:MerR family transcriptional regulator, light-induced transcriptional regulator
MDIQGQFTAALLDASGSSYAASAISRLQTTHPELSGPWSFGDLRADLEIRIQHLAQALAVGKFELLVHDLQWVSETYRARGIDMDLLHAVLGALRVELEIGLPDGAASNALGLFDRAVQAIDLTTELSTCFVSEDEPYAELAQRFLLHLLEGNPRDAERLVLEANDGGASVPDLHQHVLRRAQIEIGRQWQMGDSDTFDEHLGSRVVEDVLVILRHRMPRAQVDGRKVLVASVRSNLHGIGSRVVADHFEMAGWITFYLGADMPTADLVLAASQHDVDLVALSIGTGLHVRAAADVVAALRADEPSRKILVGGIPFVQIPDLAEIIGADATADDAAGAQRVGDRLVLKR